MGKIQSGRCIVVTLVLDIPPDVSNEQAQQVLPSSLAVALPLAIQLAFPMRGSFIEVKNEPGQDYATRFNERLIRRMGVVDGGAGAGPQ